MPNHVTNQIVFNGHQNDINMVLELIKGETECIDFEKIVPPPNNLYRGNIGPEERAKYGANNWYDWNVHNWGTKWNAYSTSVDETNNTICFDTAWSSPIPVLEALAKLCCKYNVSFSGIWADENRGYNVGVFKSSCNSINRCFNYKYVENCSSQAYEIYITLNGENNCIGRDKNGNWFHYNCDTCPNRDEC